MTFRVGQKVVCIDAAGSSSLRLNEVYTVLEILPAEWCDWRGDTRLEVGILLVEAKPKWEHGFAPERFRPIVEKKTDISFAHKILRKHTKKIGEKA